MKFLLDLIELQRILCSFLRGVYCHNSGRSKIYTIPMSFLRKKISSGFTFDVTHGLNETIWWSLSQATNMEDVSLLIIIFDHAAPSALSSSMPAWFLSSISHNVLPSPSCAIFWFVHLLLDQYCNQIFSLPVPE